MDTSFSAPCGENRTLPAELTINILSYLSLQDLISCRLVDRKFNDIINGSHQIDTAVAGVVDNPSSTLSLLARRRALARRQVAWDTCQPQNTTSFKSRDYNDVVPKHTEMKHCCASTIYERRESTILSHSPSATIMTLLLWGRCPPSSIQLVSMVPTNPTWIPSRSIFYPFRVEAVNILLLESLPST